MKLLIHIGAHKTGSTAIQSMAGAIYGDLLRSGVYYPVNLMKKYGEQHSQLALLMRRRQTKIVAQAMRLAAQRARQRRANTVFISGEEFWTLNASEIANFRRICRRYFDQQAFVAVVRKERKRVVSNFKHFLRHDDFRTEQSFIERSAVNFRSAIPLWLKNFSPRHQILSYDDLSSQLIPHFFSRLFGIQLNTNRKENFSFDFLTLQIVNVFLKDWKSPEIEALLWRYACKYENWPIFPIEEEIGKMLTARLASEHRPLVAKSAPAIRTDLPPPTYDPVEICARMSDLFDGLRQHFEQLKGVQS